VECRARKPAAKRMVDRGNPERNSPTSHFRLQGTDGMLERAQDIAIGLSERPRRNNAARRQTHYDHEHLGE